MQNIIWFFPLDLIKFGMRALIGMYNAKRGKGPGQPIKHIDGEGVPITRTQSRHESLYSNRVSFIQKAQRSVGLGGRKVQSESFCLPVFYSSIVLTLIPRSSLARRALALLVAPGWRRRCPARPRVESPRRISTSTPPPP